MVFRFLILSDEVDDFKREIKIDTERLSMVLGCPIIETSALKGDGLNKLMEEAIRTANTKEVELPADIFSAIR